MASQSIAIIITAALLLLPYGLWAAEKQKASEAKSAGVTRIELHPGSSVEIEAWGKCATITNALPGNSMLYVPVFYSDAWSEFIKMKRSYISVTPCD